MNGGIHCILYIVMISLSSVWINKLGKNIHISLMLLATSFFSLVFFNLINIKNIKHLYKSIIKQIRLWIFLSLSIVFTWFFTYYSYIHGSARLTQATFYLVIAMCSCIVLRSAIKFILCSLILALIYYVLPETSLTTYFSTMAAGISGFIFFKLSKKYADICHLNASEVLAIRFYFLFIASLIYTYIIYKNGVELFNAELPFYAIIGTLLFLAIINMIIPNYLSQSSIINLGAEKFSLLVSATPVVTFVFQAIVFHDYNFTIFCLCSAACIALTIPASNKSKEPI